MYTRASASDYDDWEKVYGNPGWGSKDLIPLLKKTETYQLTTGGPTHGADGPLKVSEGSFLTDIGQQFLQVARELDPDRAQKPDDSDTNDLETINVYTRWLKWINAETGNRSDVPHHLIYPLKETRPHLHFLTGVHVKHITFDSDNRATGVGYALNPLFHPDSPLETRTVRAKKLVVVSAGAFGTPGILERSGIGSKSVLDHVGIQQRVDLPGVGKNYQDHNGIFIPYFAAEEAQTFDAIFLGGDGEGDAATKKKYLSHNSIDAGVKWRPNPSELAELGPEFKKEAWDPYFANALDKPVLWLGEGAGLLGDPTLVPLRKYFTLAFFTYYPLARGHVHITHAEDVSAPLDFVPGYFESKADITPLIWGYKTAREIARRMPHYRGEPRALHPAFEPSGPAAVVDHADGPVAADTPPIVYSEEDERELEVFARAAVTTTWHSIGSCAMRPREQDGVVDPRLNVYGVRNLKVADLSIGPGNVAANTYSTALVVGEKAAVIIAEELGIKGII
ncbi:alcohol oxidase-like protein [Multifurca ochricompacta]|uniref:Alcohol oxidase-like protein n=1 Tax=Multifurca ochricompacta TaxID=376703 RepID=A0AAD4M439_9AGAM|nr:alcohol oxidase-like protein [Multifurca ochricompacta]